MTPVAPWAVSAFASGPPWSVLLGVVTSAWVGARIGSWIAGPRGRRRPEPAFGPAFVANLCRTVDLATSAAARRRQLGAAQQLAGEGSGLVRARDRPFLEAALAGLVPGRPTTR